MNPYKKEIYIEKGNIYAKGGAIYDFLFDDDDDEEVSSHNEEEPPVTAPAANQLPEVDMEYDMALNMAMAMNSDPFTPRNKIQSAPYGSEYDGQIRASGKYGNQNIGEYGKQIYGQLANDLGYAPEANSIYRDPQQQAELVRKGIGARNSYHLTGDAIDLKPADWNKLSPEKKAFYKDNYDVVYHNNHYHIEPQGKR